MCVGSSCTDSSCSQHFANLKTLEWAFLYNPLKVVVIRCVCRLFYHTFPFTQLPILVFGKRHSVNTFLRSQLVWVTLIVKGVADSMMDNCQSAALQSVLRPPIMFLDCKSFLSFMCSIHFQKI